MKFMKKITFSIFTFSLFFLFQNILNANASEIAVVNSYGIEINQEEYENLKDLGFTDLAIDQMNEEVFNANKDLVVDSKSETTKYYEIVEKPKELQTYSTSSTKENTSYVSTELSEEEYFERVNLKKNGIQAFASSDTTSTSYRRLTTQIQRIGTSIRLYERFVWDVVPETRSIDVLAINIDSTFTPKPGTEYGQQLWAYTNPSLGGQYGGNAVYAAGSAKYVRDSSGYGVKMDLRNDTSGARITELEGYMYYNIVRNNSTTPRYINAYGNYSHLKTTNDISFSFSLDSGGPGISFSGISNSSFDAITTHAQIAY